MSSITKILLGVAGGVLLLLVLFVAFSGGGMRGMGQMMGGPMMGGGFMILWLIFLVAIIALAVWLLMRLFASQRGAGGAERQQPRGDSAEEILRERFARGEIDAEEYEHSLEVLRGKTGAQSRTTDER